MSKLRIIRGPLSAKVSKADAEQGLVNHPEFVKGSSYTLEDVQGRWVAAIHEAAPPFEEESPSEDSPFDEPVVPEDSGSEDKKDDGPSEDEKSEEKSEKSDDKSDGEKGDKKEGLEAKVDKLTDMLTTIVDALGLSEMPPMPGDELGGPPMDVPPPPGGPEEGPKPKTHTVHERALKPGEAPPGTTPVGAPAFSSVREDHPWREIIADAANFHVESEIGETSNGDVLNELQSLASEVGYKVGQFKPFERGGKRYAKALITRY